MSKKPAVNVVSVKRSAVGGTANNLRIEIIDSSGLGREWNLSPSAQDSLLMALLARELLQTADAQAPTLMLRPMGLGRFEPHGGGYGLQFLIGVKAAVHIVLAKPLGETLKRLLDTWDDPSTWNVSAPKAH